MPKPRHLLQAASEATLTPPDSLTSTQSIARIVSATGKSLYTVILPSSSPLHSQIQSQSEDFLVELNPKFRNAIYLKRGGFVLIDTAGYEDRGGKIQGEIVNVVRGTAWMKMDYWPEEFRKTVKEDSDDEDSNVGKMPPSDDEDEEDEREVHE